MDSRRPGPDWLTALLLGAAAVLLAGLAAVGVDLWVSPPSGGWLADTGALYQPVLTQVASLQSLQVVSLQSFLPLKATTATAPSLSDVAVVVTAGAVSRTEAPVTATVSVVPATEAPTTATVSVVPATEAPAVATVRVVLPTDVPPPVMATAPLATPDPCVPPIGWILYFVKGGDTLGSVAQRFDTDVGTLVRANCLDKSALAINEQLYVPGLRESAAPLTATATPQGQRPGATPPYQVSSPSPSSTLGALATPTPGGSPTAPSPETATPWASTPTPAAATPVYVASLPTFAPTATPNDAFQLSLPNRYVNIVLLGSDKRVHGRTWRTDSMIIVSVDVENNVVRLLSIPRDLWVYIPRHGYDRINTAELWAELSKRGTGTERVKETIHHNLGIPIHYYVRVDLQGFMKIVDTVGGVDIGVDCPLPDIKLKPGVYHMDGAHALQYARSRKSTSDFDRGRRQRRVLTALWEQAKTMDIIPKLPSLWVTLADSFETDLPFDQVINLAYIGAQLKPQHILSKSIGRPQVKSWVTPGGAMVLLPREDEIRKLLESYYMPVDPTALDGMNKVRIQVLNGTQRQDAEQLAASALRWEGVQVTGMGPADRQDYAQTQIRVYQGDASAGQQVARDLGVPLSAVQRPPGAPDQGGPVDVDIQVILGGDYDPCQR